MRVKPCYREKRFSADRQEKINKANEIIEEYKRQGYELTLRQLYYQFVSRDIIPNNQREYKNLGDVINDARLAGLVDWYAIVDRTRNLRRRPNWDSPQSIIDACASQYHRDLWQGQPNRVEVWIEKDALVGIIEGTCEALDVPYFSCRGYTSQSEMWVAAMRLKGYRQASQRPVVLHFGDHDPSGIDMSRDIQERLEEFSGGDVEFRRMALNKDQVDKYNPPPNPAKLTDSRCEGYIEKHGSESWELDALEPSVITGLIRGEIESLTDPDILRHRRAVEESERNKLGAVARNWETLTANL